MKVTHFGVGGFPWAHVSNFGGVTVSIGSNSDSNPPLSALNFVQRITANSSNVLLNPVVNFAAGSNILLTLDQGPLPAQAMPSNTIRIHSTGGSGGTILTANGSNSLAAVVNLQAGTNIALGVSGQTITITNTAAASGGGGGGATASMVWLQRQTASTSAQLDFTSFITSTYETYWFVFQNLIPATNNQNLLVRMGTGGGPTYDTGSNYIYSNLQSGAGGNFGNNSSSATSIQIIHDVNNTTSHSTSGWMQLHNPSSAIYKTVNVQGMARSSDGNHYMNVTGGIYTSTTAVTAIRFFFASGNITSGAIDVYGVTHA